MTELLNQLPNGGAVVAIIVVTYFFLDKLMKVTALFVNELAIARKEYFEHLRSLTDHEEPETPKEGIGMPRDKFDPNNLSYERMRGEPPKAFSAFLMYRDMGAERTLERVRVSLGNPPGYLKALQAWSSRYEWVERCALWDNDRDRESRKVVERNLSFWETQRQQSLAANLRQAKALRDKVDEMLKHPITSEIRDDYRGVIEIHAAKWTYQSLAATLKVAAEMEAATIGEAFAGAIDDGFDVDTASIEELKAYINRTRKGKSK